jgi:hypothetical protein
LNHLGIALSDGATAEDSARFGTHGYEERTKDL